MTVMINNNDNACHARFHQYCCQCKHNLLT